MDLGTADQSSPTCRSRQRVSTACEACRANKIRCQPSEQPGVCRKCLSSKRECISRTGPRTRHPRKRVEEGSSQSQPLPVTAAASAATLPTPGPSTTFSIDFEVPTQSEIDDNFEILQDSHARFIEALFPPEPDGDPWQSTLLSVDDLQSPLSSSTASHSIEDLRTKPTFNLASAECLLASFRSMLIHLPCIVLPDHVSVPHLAKTRPFVLLAILAAASGSRTLQGHSLYDEEFRKVLGLKFVAGGERSLELLQGILIYCAWHPFHLRPRNKQSYQYMRMAADLIRDLELDQEFPLGILEPEVTEQQLDGIRAYLGYYYASSAFVLARNKHKNMAMSFTPWTATCCDVLERNAQVDGDSVLSSLARVTSTIGDVSEALHERKGQTEHQAKLMLKGLEVQAKELEARLPPFVTSSTAVRMQLILVSIYLDGGPLLKFPSPSKFQADGYAPSTPDKLLSCAEGVKNFLDLILGLSQEEILNFSVVDWIRLILSIIVAVRLSFPLTECPGFDPTWARSHIRLDKFLDTMCPKMDLTPAAKKVDVLSASRVVFAVVRDRYNREVERQNATMTAPAWRGCPMLDKSLDQYISSWDSDYRSSASAVPTSGSAGSPQIFHDLWATMTVGWTTQDHMFNGQK